ncbi:acyl-CoA thioesterase [Paenibacillus nasutitermitis]|uniref:Acyl-CoA thioesterase n=2 Tax=Paenibacillus nasutitermitis TaxID=1652958 RepID=A0A916YRA2_9BACL|nr:acyl-CoA thioesterase [Paenibacillus nasutitermitis]
MGRGQVTVGFLGGSITDARPGHNWPEKVMNWLANRYPDVRFIVENAAIGATGSESAVFRAARDITSRNCDIVFVEYAVNDYYTASGMRKKTREGLLRQLLGWGHADLVLTYTYLQAMYEPMFKGEQPDSIEEFEQLAEHYGISSVWMGLYAFEEVKNGSMTWEEWLPDGLHPTHRGSFSYAQSVIAFLERELPTETASSETTSAKGANPDPRPVDSDGPAQSASISSGASAGTGGTDSLASVLPEPLDPLHWGEVSLLPFSQVELEGPWTIQRSSTLVWIDHMLVTSAIGAKLRFRFNGRGLALGFDFGKLASEFRYRLDGGEAVDVSRDREDWCINEGWFRFTTLSDEWENGPHEIEIEVTHGDRPECTGTHFRLGYIGVIH